MMKEENYWLGFSVFSGIGPKRFKLFYDYFGSAKKIWQAKKEALLATGLQVKIVNDLIRFRQQFNPDFYQDGWLKKKSIFSLSWIKNILIT